MTMNPDILRFEDDLNILNSKHSVRIRRMTPKILSSCDLVGQPDSMTGS